MKGVAEGRGGMPEGGHLHICCPCRTTNSVRFPLILKRLNAETEFYFSGKITFLELGIDVIPYVFVKEL